MTFCCRFGCEDISPVSMFWGKSLLSNFGANWKQDVDGDPWGFLFVLFMRTLLLTGNSFSGTKLSLVLGIFEKFYWCLVKFKGLINLCY